MGKTMKPLRIFIIAGELSGDNLGGALMKNMSKELKNQVVFTGVGGPLMQAQGLDSLFDMSKLSIMGLVEVIPKIPMLISKIKQTSQAIIKTKPDAIITIDSPDFCFRVLKKIKQSVPDIPVIHYVAPSVWAWRPERAQKMARYVDHVLALLPFEPPYMQAVGMSCDFVGHPAAFCAVLEAEILKKFKAKIGQASPIITLLPGSRLGEIKRMMPIFKQVVERVVMSYPDAKFILPAAKTVSLELNQQLKGWNIKPIVLQGKGNAEVIEREKSLAYAISDIALATSGTVSLELAAQNCPMIVAYKTNWATTRMVKKLAKIDTANLVNIVTKKRLVPEFLFENCNVDKISHALITLLGDKVALKKQKKVLKQTMNALGRGQNMEKYAVKSVLNFLGV